MTGLTDFTLAFLLAGETGGCTPTWGGTAALDDRKITTEIKKISAYGGQPIVSTGGASGTYLEQVCEATELATAYGKALDSAGSDHLDVDIEQKVDVATVISALSSLQQSRGTLITFTVPAETAGLAAGGVPLLRAARAAGLDVTVNAMVMNFDADGDWGAAMAAATEAVRDDLAAIWTDRDDTRCSASPR